MIYIENKIGAEFSESAYSFSLFFFLYNASDIIDIRVFRSGHDYLEVIAVKVAAALLSVKRPTVICAVYDLGGFFILQFFCVSFP